MEKDKNAKISRILNFAISLDDAHKESYIRDKCEGNKSLETEILSRMMEIEKGKKTHASGLGGTSAMPDPTDLTGRMIGKIQIIRRLGHGSMGDVFLGFDEKLKREVAVKVIRGTRRLHEESKARFLREAEVLSKLEHPYISRIYDFVEQDDCDFLIMELVQGLELTKSDAFHLDHKAKLRISLQIAEVLVAAHTKNIVHRDLKPENVMLTEHGDIKVLDFGLSHVIRHPGAEIEKVESENHSENRTDVDSHMHASPNNDGYCTELGQIVGTLEYMSPEQALCAPSSAASDMYSFGLLLQWLYTGESPYPYNLDYPAFLYHVSSGATEPVRNVNSELKDLINHLKTFEPNLRPTAVETVQRLHWIMNKAKRIAKRVVIGSFMVILLLGIVISSIGFLKAKKEERRAVQETETAKKTVELLQEFLSSADPREKGKDLKVIDLIRTFQPRIEQMNDSPEIQASLYFTYGKTYLGLGAIEEAYHFSKIAVDLRKELLGDDHPDTLEAQEEVASSLDSLGKYNEAEKLNREILKKRKTILGKEHPKTLKSMNLLAGNLNLQGKNEEAKSLNLVVIQKRVELLGEDHPDSISSLHDLARTLAFQGNYLEAERVFLEVLHKCKKVLGEDHTVTLFCMQNLAAIYGFQEKYEEAVHLCRVVLEKMQSLYGGEHPKTLTSMNNLAMELAAKGDYEESKELRAFVLEVRKRVLGENHPSTILSLGSMAKLIEDNGNIKEAEKLFLNLLTKSISNLGEKNPYTLDIMGQLANNLQKQEKYIGSEKLLRRIVAIQIKLFGREHPSTKETFKKLVNSLMLQGKREEAAAFSQSHSIQPK